MSTSAANSLNETPDEESQSNVSEKLTESDKLSPIDSPSKIPSEGGKDAVMTVVGAFLACLVQFGVVNLVGVLQVQ